MFKNLNLNNRGWGEASLAPAPALLYKYSLVNYTMAVYTRRLILYAKFLYVGKLYTL